MGGLRMRTICFFLAVTAIIFSAVFFTAQVVKAQGADKAGGDISIKLDEIVTTQKAILEELAAIKNELYIIKIRVTQNQ